MFGNVHSKRTRAFTLVELLVVVAVIGTLAALYLPATNRAQMKARQLQCLMNLHQAGLAFQMFAQDHDTRYPMGVPVREGGSKEYAIQGQAFRHFQVMSNLLQQPRILLCPADKLRHPAASWSSLQNENLSSFVGLDAHPGRGDHLLAGDRNVTNQTVVSGTILFMTTNDIAGWTRNLHDRRGNVLFADGRVEQLNSEGLQAALRKHGQYR